MSTKSSRLKATGQALILCAFTLTLYIVAAQNHYIDFKDQYNDVVSEHYSLIADDENFCYHLLDENQNTIGGTIDYGDPILIHDNEKKH